MAYAAAATPQFANPTPDRSFLLQIFQRVDKDRNGSISALELQSALGNGTFTPFNPTTIRMLINMFDRRQVNEITFEEFIDLWKYVIEWQNCFRSFDRDNSGFIDKYEFKQALSSFGYRLSDTLVDLFIKKFDRQGRTSLAFDDFIQACVALNTFTSAFRQHDYQQNGTITIGYEQFLTLIIELKAFL